MYLTAQRVRARSQSGTGDTGISVAYYRHGTDIPRLQSGIPDIVRISTTEPGTLISSAADIPSGGNDVLSYLDIVAPDNTSSDELLRFLGALELETATVALPMTWEYGDRAVTFSVRGVSGERAKHEFAALKNRLLAHFRATLKPIGLGDPFVASLLWLEDAVEIQWLPSSKQRLTDLKFAAGRSIRIAFDISEQWKAFGPPAPLIAHALAAMSGVDLHELVIRGGVRVVDGERTIWERLPA